jgi:transcription-repair coupling factor (superfamily II helicase)
MQQQGEENYRPKRDCQVDISINAHIPDHYIESYPQRIAIYKRIADIHTKEDAMDVTDELIDRYGTLPAAAETLLDVSQLRALCNRLGVSRVTRGKEGLIMTLDERFVPDPACLLQAISETDGRLALSARASARMILKTPELQEQELLQEALKVIRKLEARVSELEEAAREIAEKEAAAKAAEETSE